ncbi:DUF262 domain-containing protein [Tunturiibacter lichenicola]
MSQRVLPWSEQKERIKLQTSPVRLIDYFDGTKQSVIPLFQRRYSWTKKNWDRLWDDIVELIESGPQHTHFMGAIVSVPTNTVPVGVNKSLIIDGQQRLTTISILLCALRGFLDERGSARIDDFLTNRHFEGADHLKILPTQGDRDIFVRLVNNEPVIASDHLMARAYKHFVKRLRDDEEGAPTPADVMATLETKLRVVMINLDEQDDPYVIFESLNYLGEPLTHADLVRNYILMKFKNTLDSDSDQERVYREQWVPMEQRLGEKLTTFLMHYGRKDGTEVRKNTIYSSFKERIERLQDTSLLEGEIKSLNRDSEYYERFLNPEREELTALRSRLKALEALDVSSCYPLLLKLYGAMDAGAASADDTSKCLDLLESYLVRRAVVGLPNNAIDQLFVQAAGLLEPSDIVNSTNNRLAAATGRMRWPTDAEFVQAILTQQQYGKKSTPHVLRKLEEVQDHREMAVLDQMQIEHVMPQVLSADWLTTLGPEAEEIKDRLLHTLGNLTLTGYNPQLSNQSFAAKKEIYRDSHIELNQWIADREVWGEEQITQRANNLAQECVRIWAR